MWRHEGIDAGELARMLMSSAADTVSGGSTDVLHGESSARAPQDRAGCRSHALCSTWLMHALPDLAEWLK